MEDSGKIDAAADQSLDQIRAGDRTGQIGALGQIRRRGFVRREAELERHRVFAQDVGQAFQFAVRRREERHAIALLHHGSCASATATCMLPWKAMDGRVRDVRRLRRPDPARADRSAARGRDGFRNPPNAKKFAAASSAASAAGRGASTGARPRHGSAPARRERRRRRRARSSSDCSRGSSSAAANSQPGNSAPCARLLGQAAECCASEIFITERCDSTSKRRMDSISSPKNSMRSGRAFSAGNTSRMPPRMEYSPTISTGSRRS